MFWVIFWWYDTFENWIVSAAWTLIELVGRNNRWCKRYKYLKIRPQNQQCGGKGKYSKPKPAKYWAAIFGEHLNWDKYCAIFGKLLNWGLAASQPPWNRPGMTAVFLPTGQHTSSFHINGDYFDLSASASMYQLRSNSMWKSNAG